MKIDKIIKMKRIEKNLTQEQLSSMLGISTAAISKWESGHSYPDITLLPRLARILNVDLNTLLSFKENLDKKEVSYIINKLSEELMTIGFDTVYDKSMDLISEYPNDDFLVYHIATILKGGLLFAHLDKSKKDLYSEEVSSLYMSLINSDDEEIKNGVKLNIIGESIEKADYDQAEEILNSLPDYHRNKKIYQAMLYSKKGDIQKSFEIYEGELLNNASSITTILASMIELAVKNNDLSDAKYYADLSSKTVDDFNLWKYTKYVAHMQYGISTKDKEMTINSLKSVFSSFENSWDLSESVLYKHMEFKGNSDEYLSNFKAMFIKTMTESEEFDFLRDDDRFIQMLNQSNQTEVSLND